MPLVGGAGDAGRGAGDFAGAFDFDFQFGLGDGGELGLDFGGGGESATSHSLGVNSLVLSTFGQPSQPVNLLWVARVAVRMTLAPLANSSVQVVPHWMPAGLEVTSPEPVPAKATERAIPGSEVKTSMRWLAVSAT